MEFVLATFFSCELWGIEDFGLSLAALHTLHGS